MSAVVVAAAGEVAAAGGRWALQPSLVAVGAVVLLIAGFYLGRISDDIHRWWLDLWTLLGRWSVYALCGAGLITVLYVLGQYLIKSRGGG